MIKNTLTRSDFSNSNEVRWCPGCGDYAILAAFQRILPELGLPPEKHVFVSGIGCAGRLPYYMNAYGFHTLHGRATAIATGLKALRDDVCVWVITGDGDALSIGTNHLVHAFRRNLNVNIVLVNNQVYGLTKGQFSPTSPKGKVTKTSPHGVQSEAINPLALALGSNASFVARAVDKDPKHLGNMLKAAYAHQGTSFVEVYQDCHIFNQGAFDAFSTKTNREENTIYLEPGCDVKRLKLNAETHNPADFMQAMQLANLTFPEHPVPLGVYYQKERDVFTLKPKANKKRADLSALYRAKASWQVLG
ncbi:MAG: 2-oxoacid:ferredoxin oxidoreductase subunit beta [Gammaproteobacteria bacterium]|nr:2-oxoacid:ferredoxin oxidoreductase subunit beta [Gammaproteobacteria bacterium]MCH9764187.1 2-oxoacid:ferredoxin oxidoreductase subunit beta [Gammaproteobacteria bacterium]